jgi:TatD DNase family protein
LIDIGVNLTNKRFDKDRLDLLQRAKSVGINALLVTGTNLQESRNALDLCQQSPNYLACTAGIHPHEADHAPCDYLEQLAILANSQHVKAIGECGLDFNRNFSTPENQRNIFQGQIALAAQENLPLFLHQRDAFEPWFSLLSPYIGWLCDERRGQELRDIVNQIPLSQLMIETDAPYLTPRTIRPRPKSSRNEPCYLPYVVKTLAEVTQYSEDEIRQQTTHNAMRVFNLGECND